MPESPYLAKDVTIANGAATSGAVDILGYRVTGAKAPGTWTAADLGIQLSPDGKAAPVDVRDAEDTLVRLDGFAADKLMLFGTEAIAAGSQVGPAPLLAGVSAAVRSVNAASEADLNQGAARVVTLMLARL